MVAVTAEEGELTHELTPFFPIFSVAQEKESGQAGLSSASGDLMKNPHWHYFTSLEKDFLDSIQYVELDEANKGAFSIVYAKMLFSACAEVEVVLKALCERIASGSVPKSIDQYREIVLRGFPSFHKIEIQIPRYLTARRPWTEWGIGKNPSWWHAYTRVKHNRAVAFAEANQGNVIEALAGLFGCLVYLYQNEIDAGNLGPEPQLFEYPSMFPEHLVCSHKLELPT